MYVTIVWRFTVGFYNIGGVLPVWTLVLIVSTILAMVAAHTSKEDKKPAYHRVNCVAFHCFLQCWLETVVLILFSIGN